VKVQSIITPRLFDRCDLAAARVQPVCCVRTSSNTVMAGMRVAYASSLLPAPLAAASLPSGNPPIMRSVIALLILLSSVTSHVALAQATDALSGEAETIRFRVVVDAPRSHRQMLEQGLDIVRWQRDERVTMALLERLVGEARKAAAEALAADGYFSARVESRIDKRTGGETLVHIEVDPGPRTRVRGVDIAVQGSALADEVGRKRVEVVRQTWRLMPGEPFRQSEWDAAKDAALAQLSKGRYAAAAITESEARVDPEARAADLKLRLDSGPIFRAGPTIVSGLRRYPAAIVENLNPLERGEPYDALQLDLYQRRLIETGYFSAVHFAVEPDPAEAAAAPLRVTVIEAPSQRIDTGLAFSTDTGFGITVDYSNVDMFDAAWRLRPRLMLNQREQELNVTLDTPPRAGAVWNTYTARVERRDIRGDITREGMIGYAYNWGLESTPSQVAISGHVERETIAGSVSQSKHAVFVGYRKTFRTTDDLMAPRRGVLGTAEIGTSIPGLSSQQFVRLHGKINWLIPLGLRNDVLVRGEAGAVLADSRAGVVSSFLFRTGGDQTIRGYGFESIGVAQGNAIVGGRYMALASLEYTRWVTDALGAAVFLDAGDAFDDPGAFKLHTGAGIGVRWRSPIGPFRADVAYGLRTEKMRLHFSVGFSF
jgi:translocation and assembly module TamA